MNNNNEAGTVYLVGAGPGETDLITMKGLKLLKKADVVLYDYLANKKLLNYTKENAEIIYVGKSNKKHTLEQKEINKLLIEKARQNNIVIRLKGGDPFIFGRGGEEALALSKAGIRFEIIPGVTSAIAAPAYSGIPITHRGLASSVRFITGHETPEKSADEISYKHLAKDNGTLIFLMGVKNLKKIVNELLNNGKSPYTPVALIQNGTLKSQKVLTGTLQNIIEVSEKNNFSSPGIILVGKVVTLREKLMWFEKKPLFGRKIIVTRTREQASKLSELLEENGAVTYEIPTIEISFMVNDELKNLIRNIQRFKWIIFTSANGVDSFFRLLFQSNLDTRILAGIKVGAIGKQTAKQIENYLIKPDFFPSEYTSECFSEEFIEKFDIRNKDVLLVQSNLSRDVIEKVLYSKGAYIEKAIFYETKPPVKIANEVLQELSEAQIDWVTFTSSSTVDNFFKIYNGKKKFLIASIGPITSKSIIKHGHKPDVEAKEHTVRGLVEAIIHYEKTCKMKN